jgi:hypothetical protein
MPLVLMAEKIRKRTKLRFKDVIAELVGTINEAIPQELQASAVENWKYDSKAEICNWYYDVPTERGPRPESMVHRYVGSYGSWTMALETHYAMN